MCKEDFVSFANENCLMWAGCVSSAEAYSVGHQLGACSFPFVALLTCVRNAVTMVEKCEGTAFVQPMMELSSSAQCLQAWWILQS